jgi:hypothetical protein
MKNEKSKKQINPDEVVKWFNVFSLLVNLIKSVFGKKSSTKETQPPQAPSVMPDEELLKNQNLSN